MLFSKETPGQALKWRLIGRAGKILIDSIFTGSRIEVQGEKAIRPIVASQKYIFAFWHSRILLISYMHKGLNAAILVSDSADGEIIAQILQRQGYKPVRGSTGKGGSRAAARLIREMRTHRRGCGIVPDGPQGPRYKVQPGVLFLARKTGYPIIPVTYSAHRCKVFNSWDRFMLPYPATTCRLVYGRPMVVPAESDPVQIDASARDLEEELLRITRAADARFGHPLL